MSSQVDWQTWQNISFYVYGGILIPVYGWLIYKTIKGSNFSFVKKVALLLLLSSVGAIANCILYEKLRLMNTTDNSGFSIVLVSILISLALFIQNGGFALGQWIFSYQYYEISRTMPYVFER